jgi:inner membrane protein
MIKRTHFVIGLALALLFLPHINYKLVFFPIVLICALLPDIDSPNSYFGHHNVFRPMQFLVKHRGIFHSLTLCILVSIVLAFVLPIAAFPFFLGYSSHLLADSFTQDGITPFWPWKRTINGLLTTGGRVEYGIFIGFIAANILLFLRLFI